MKIWLNPIRFIQTSLTSSIKNGLNWTKFQGTRGMFRTFALLLREAIGKDLAAFVGPNALLATDAKLSDALQELVKACDEGNQWTPILTGELERARTIQKDLPLLTSREIEAAVLSTFLHSQPYRAKSRIGRFISPTRAC